MSRHWRLCAQALITSRKINAINGEVLPTSMSDDDLSDSVACYLVTFSCIIKSRWISDKCELSCLPMKSSVGEMLVIVCGVGNMIFIKKTGILVLSEPVLLLFKLSWSVCCP